MTGNSFLDSLPSATRVRLLSSLKLGRLEKGRVLSEPGVLIEEIFFPVRSVISTLMPMIDGRAVEVGLAGHEGMSALAVAFGNRVGPLATVVQIADSAYSMGTHQFLQELECDPQLKARALAYAEYSFTASTQFAACNGLHSVEQRYARWILMAGDRVGNDEFGLTQEYSAQMLGVRRAGVTEVALSLSSSGLITYHRGRIKVLDRDGLEETACECYGAVNAELQRLMGYSARARSRVAV